jgi:hypothetical protein
MNHIVAISGGKDSTALALRLAEIEPKDYTYLITPTGDELPDMVAHWENLENLLGKKFLRITNHDLNFWIEEFGALPNWRQRWCTRLLKIEPCLAYVRENQPATMYVGLRADEGERQGIYSNDVITDFPLRRWGWGLSHVTEYLKFRGIAIPERTDCARCYDQRVYEWKRLWQRYPNLYAEAEAQEEKVGATFRSDARDTWPAKLSELRKEFEAGRKTQQEKKQELIQIRQMQAGLFPDLETGEEEELMRCRVCRL